MSGIAKDYKDQDFRIDRCYIHSSRWNDYETPNPDRLATPEVVRQGGSEKESQNTGINIANLITDFDIYENLDKPYLTGEMIIVDTVGLIEKIDFQGFETLEIYITNTTLPEDYGTVKKLFAIEKITNAKKSNQNTDVLHLKLIEYHAFVSSVKNLSVSLKGKPNQIISDIGWNHLFKRVVFPEVHTTAEQQRKIKLVVPNMHPLQAMEWISKHMTSHDGLPFFLYSTLCDTSLNLVNLGTMLKADPWNAKSPFIWSQGYRDFNNSTAYRYWGIQDYSQRNNHNLLKLIREGCVGARYDFINTYFGRSVSLKYNIADDGMTNLAKSEVLSPGQADFNFGSDYKIEGHKLQDHISRHVSVVSSSECMNDGNREYLSINEEDSWGNYMQKINSRVFRNFLMKTPMEIQVAGKHFLNGSNNYTLGRTIRILFLNSENDASGADDHRFDDKKSGDYIVYATRHMFKSERYDTRLYCVKLADTSDITTVTKQSFRDVSQGIWV